MKRLLPLLLLVLAVAAGIVVAVDPFGEPPEVVIYTAVDEDFAHDLLARFTAETGIAVKVVTDTEATKTVGLANTLREEGAPGKRPRCDVYWNNEPLWTVRLAKEGILAPYASPAAADIPAEFKDPDGLWCANGLRARIFIVHPGSLDGTEPASYRDLADPAWKDRGALARPFAGTTLSHMAALRASIGAEAWETWFRAVAGNDTTFPSGNGSLAREVGRGQRAFGFTDTDDYVVRRVAGDPVELVFPDQEEGGLGTFVLPITVALVRDAPHPENAKRLIDWLLSPGLEASMSASDYATIPVRASTPSGPNAVSLADFRAARPDWNEAVEHIDAVLDVAKDAVSGN